MEPHRTLHLPADDHPDTLLQRIGFDLTDPYVEHRWSALIVPSSTLLLRRLPALWLDRVPAEIGASQLSRSLGLGAGAGEHSRVVNTLERLVRFRFATPAAGGAGLDVYRQVAPLGVRQLARLPEWTRDTHERLFGAHLERVDHLASHQASVASITARIDRLQHGAGHAVNTVTPHGEALGQ